MKKCYITKEELEKLKVLRDKLDIIDMQKSIGKEKISRKNTKVSNRFTFKYFYTRVIPLLITSCIAINMLSTTIKDISNTNTANEVIRELEEKVYYNLEEKGIIKLDNDNNIIVNTAYIKNNDNIRIDNTSISGTYAYLMLLQKYKVSEEDRNYIISIMTYNTNARYKNWEDFYIRNNLLNENGNPSLKAFYNASKEEIVNTVNDNDIDSLIGDISINKERIRK